MRSERWAYRQYVIALCKRRWSNRGTEIAEPVVRPAVLDATPTPSPGNRGTEMGVR